MITDLKSRDRKKMKMIMVLSASGWVHPNSPLINNNTNGHDMCDRHCGPSQHTVDGRYVPIFYQISIECVDQPNRDSTEQPGYVGCGRLEQLILDVIKSVDLILDTFPFGLINDLSF